MNLPKEFYIAEQSYLTPPEYEETIEHRYCENCGLELTEREIISFDGLCRDCYEEEEYEQCI